VTLSEVIKLAARGDGVTADGRHVALAAPGDMVDIAAEIIPGPHHVSPPCRHFPKCGGCQLQHVDDESYADYLVERIGSALAAQKLDLPEIRMPHLSPPRARRRASLRAERLGKRIVFGFNEAVSHYIVDIRECHILLPELFALVDPLRTLLGTMLAPRKAANVHLTWTDQGADLAIDGVTVDGLAAHEALTDFAQTHRLARIAIDEGYGSEPRWEPESVTTTIGGLAVGLPIKAFLQATADGAAALTEAIGEAVGDAAIVADLFAGLGTFALSLAPARVYAAEAGRDAIMSLKAAAGRAGRQVFADHRDLYRRPLTVEELGRFGAVVLDPPRAGARDQAAGLAQATTPIIAYVSCNPSSFARDAQVICEGGYRLDWIQPVGQFRWSTHVELAARFSR